MSTAEGVALAKQIGATFFETSAKTCVNVHEAFYCAMRELRKRRSVHIEAARRSVVTLLCVRRFRKSVLSVLPKDVCVLIAKAVWDTRRDMALWTPRSRRKSIFKKK